MFKRKIISKLEQWKQNHTKEAILIKGARQVGKTTSVRNFAQNHYEYFVEINFEMTPEAKQAFSGSKDFRSVINRLSLMGYGPFVPNKTLLFLDEIQSCPDARTAIKFLVEEGTIDIIESGSLLGLNYADISSYPVGFESQIEMFPLDFEEWLWANNVSDDNIRNLRNYFENNEPLSDFEHEQYSRLYRDFLIVGGMPKVVSTYLDNPDFSETLRQQRILIDSYRADIAKYAATAKTKAMRFFDAIPSQLSKERKRYILNDIQKHNSMQKYEDATQWLSDAGVAHFCYNTHVFSLPFEQNENLNLFKVYLLDTGLLCAMWSDNVQLQIKQGNLSVNEGAITENFVANELVKHGHTLHYFDRKSRNELDFITGNNGRIDVIEVKSGNDYKRHTSLDKIKLSEPNTIGTCTVLSKFNSSFENGVNYLPLYMAMFI